MVVDNMKFGLRICIITICFLIVIISIYVLVIKICASSFTTHYIQTKQHPMSTLVKRVLQASPTLSTKYCSKTTLAKPWLDTFGRNRKARGRMYYARLLDLIAATHQTLTDRNITHVMAGGTLLGSLFFHDFIPWDEDADFLILYEDVNETIISLNLIPGVMCEQNVRGGKLLYLKVAYDRREARISHGVDAKPAHSYFWSLPYIDLFILSPHPRHTDHFVQLDDTRNVWKKSVFFPLHLRPFASLWLPSSAKPYSQLAVEFRNTLPRPMHFPCRLPPWDHDREVAVPPRRVDCGEISRTYPVVSVERDGNTSVEVVRMRGKELYTCLLPEVEANLPHKPLRYPDGVGE